MYLGLSPVSPKPQPLQLYAHDGPNNAQRCQSRVRPCSRPGVRGSHARAAAETPPAARADRGNHVSTPIAHRISGIAPLPHWNFGIQPQVKLCCTWQIVVSARENTRGRGDDKSTICTCLCTWTRLKNSDASAEREHGRPLHLALCARAQILATRRPMSSITGCTAAAAVWLDGLLLLLEHVRRT